MKRKVSNLVVCLMMLFMATSCFNNKMGDLLKKVPENVDLVMVGDVKTVIESAGGSIEDSRIKLPSYITNEMKSTKDYDEFDSFIKKSGIDVEACALALNYNDGAPIIVFAINDNDKFVKAIENEDFKEADKEDGVTYYKSKDNSDYESEYHDFIAIKGSIAYLRNKKWDSNDSDAKSKLSRFIEDASDKSFSSTKCSDYITEGNAFGLAFKLPQELKREVQNLGVSNDIADMYNGTICMNGDLSDSDAEIKMKWFDEDGKELDLKSYEKHMDFDAKINPDALAYLGKDECLVYASSLKNVDWDTLFNLSNVPELQLDQKAMLTLVKSYLEKIDGTVAIGMGLTNGLNSISSINSGNNIMGELPLTMVCETKSGKAPGMVNDIKTLLANQGFTYNNTASGLVVDVPYNNGSIYIESKGDMLVLSNHAIKAANSNPTVQNIDFKDKIAIMGLYLSHNNPLMRDLSIKNDIKVYFTYDTKNYEASMHLTIDGEKSAGIIEKVAKMMIAVSKQQSPSWQNTYDTSAYDEECDTVAYDDVACDSVVED